MESAKKISLNIVTQNSLAYLPNFFNSLDTQQFRDFTVTVVDNASNDGTVKWLHDNRPEVTVLKNFRIQSKSRAVNQAIEFALSRWAELGLQDKYFLFIALGLELAPNFLTEIIIAIENDPEVASLCPKIMSGKVLSVAEDGVREIEITNRIVSTGLLMTRSREVRHRGKDEEDKGQWNASSDVFGASDYIGLYRASSLLEIKDGNECVDEDFANSLIFADLAWRLRVRGYKSRYVAEAIAYKHSGVKEDEDFLTLRNRYWLIWKNDELLNRLAHSPWIFVDVVVTFFRSLISLNRIKARIAAIGGLPKMIKKRRQILEKAKVTGPSIRKWFV